MLLITFHVKILKLSFTGHRPGTNCDLLVPRFIYTIYTTNRIITHTHTTPSRFSWVILFFFLGLLSAKRKTVVGGDILCQFHPLHSWPPLDRSYQPHKWGIKLRDIMNWIHDFIQIHVLRSPGTNKTKQNQPNHLRPLGLSCFYELSLHAKC